MSVSYSIVIPLFNEAEVFNDLIERLDGVVSKMEDSLEIVMVDDGSSDNTRMLLVDLAKRKKGYRMILLSRNFGHQVALSAGLKHAMGTKGVMVIDADLQDPPEMIFEFISKLEEGFDVAVGTRKKRKMSAFDQVIFKMFYRFLNAISYIDITLDGGDFSMMSRRVVDVVNEMPEQSRYLRGMRSWVGFKQCVVPYEREARELGESKYGYIQLIKLAYEGIFNFSWFPIRLMTYLGAFGFVICFSYLAHLLYLKFTSEEVPVGFTAIVVLIIFIGSIQMVFSGVLGEYLVRSFIQVKNRPLYVVDKIIESDEE